MIQFRSYSTFYITLLELQKYTFDFLYIKCITTHCLNLNTIIGNIYNKTPNNIYIKYKNYYKKTELISFKKRYSMLYNSIKLNFKDFFDYTIDDIDRSTLNIRSNIKYILKNIVTNKITYDFKNKQYPIKINLMNTIINQTTLKKICTHNNFKQLLEIYNLSSIDINIYLSLMCFYNDIKFTQHCFEEIQD